MTPIQRALQIFFLAILATPILSHAITLVQANPEPPPGWSGTLGLSYTGKRGNVDKQEYDLGLSVQHTQGPRTILAIADHAYGESEQERNENEAYLHMRWIENDALAPAWDAEAYTQWEHDDFKNLSLRRLIGGGTRWRFGHDRLHSLDGHYLGFGVFYEQERSVDGTINSGVRANLYSRLQWAFDSADRPLKPYLTVYVQPMLDDLQDLRSVAIAGVKLTVFKPLSLSLQWQWIHDSKPLPDVRRSDYEYNVVFHYALQ